MRVSKEKEAENRRALLDAASRLFRKCGIDGVGVATIAQEAGLTHGALYANFPSKEALAAEAFSHGFDGNMASFQSLIGDRRLSFDEHLEMLFATERRDSIETGCPLGAAASETARHGSDMSLRYAQAFEQLVAMLEEELDGDIPASRRRTLAVATITAQIGAIAVSRAVAKANMGLSDEVLRAVHETIDRSHKVEIETAE